MEGELQWTLSPTHSHIEMPTKIVLVFDQSIILQVSLEVDKESRTCSLPAAVRSSHRGGRGLLE